VPESFAKDGTIYQLGLMHMTARIGYWVVHIIIPADAAMGVLASDESLLSHQRQHQKSS
jgi:hypothetical protein